MIRKGGYRFSLATNAKRLRGDHAQNKEIERDDDSKKNHPALAGPRKLADQIDGRLADQNIEIGDDDILVVQEDKVRSPRSQRLENDRTIVADVNIDDT